MAVAFYILSKKKSVQFSGWLSLTKLNVFSRLTYLLEKPSFRLSLRVHGVTVFVNMKMEMKLRKDSQLH